MKPSESFWSALPNVQVGSMDRGGREASLEVSVNGIHIVAIQRIDRVLTEGKSMNRRFVLLRFKLLNRLSTLHEAWGSSVVYPYTTAAHQGPHSPTSTTSSLARHAVTNSALVLEHVVGFVTASPETKNARLLKERVSRSHLRIEDAIPYSNTG